LTDQRFIEVNPALDVERPKLTANEGETAIISDDQARDLLNTPDPATLKGKRQVLMERTMTLSPPQT
jgi:hypothetical protein